VSDDTTTRLKRMRLRAWRRGTREMDLILGGFADSQLAELDEAARAEFEALLEEDDQDLYDWVSGRVAVPPAHRAILRRIARSRRI